MLYRGKRGTKGFTLIELAIVLGITGLLFTGLWRLLSNGNQQLRDQATASQQQQLITAVSTYLATTHGQNWMGAIAASGSNNLPLPTSSPVTNVAGGTTCATAIGTTLSDLCTILPPGFSATTVNPYGQTYVVHVFKDATPAPNPPQSYSFMIVTTGGDTISDTDGGRISSMIGGDGGFIYSNNVCGAPVNQMACGAYGAWSQNITANYGFVAPFVPTSGTVASRTYYTPTQNSMQPWLARVPMPGDTNFGYNTMSTDMYVGALAGGGPYNMNLVAPTAVGTGVTGASINMGGAASGVPGGSGVNAEVAAPTGGGAINLSGGTINMVNAAATSLSGGNTVNGALNLQGGTINMVNSTNPTTGGGVINLQGGVISDSTSNYLNNAISITATTPLDEANAQPLVTLSTGCSQANVAVAAPNDGIKCVAGLQVTGDEYVVGQLTANSLYAQTFIYNGSDMRLKTDIRTLQHALDDIMKLNPVTFHYKATGQPNLGVIAQEVEKVYPQLVITRPDGMKSVSYEGLVAPLIGAVQELKKESDDLRDQLKAQELREDRLERELKKKP